MAMYEEDFRRRGFVPTSFYTHRRCVPAMPSRSITCTIKRRDNGGVSGYISDCLFNARTSDDDTPESARLPCS